MMITFCLTPPGPDSHMKQLQHSIIFILFPVNCSSISSNCENCSLSEGVCSKCRAGSYLQHNHSTCHSEYEQLYTSSKNAKTLHLFIAALFLFANETGVFDSLTVCLTLVVVLTVLFSLGQNLCLISLITRILPPVNSYLMCLQGNSYK